jgi:hypothetical protein
MLDELKTILNHTRGKVIMLTARSDFDDKETFLKTFADYGIDMSQVHVHRAGNLPGNEIPAEKKAVWVRKYLETGEYDQVSLYDDSMSNLKVFKALSDEYPDVTFHAYHISGNGQVSTLDERKKRKKRKSRLYGAWGPGPFGMYGTNVGYSGDMGGGGDGGGMEEVSLVNKLEWPEIVNKVNSAMKAMGWKGGRKGDDAYIFSTKGQETDDQYYFVVIENVGKGHFSYALGTVEEGDPDIGEQGHLPNTEASVSELMDAIREGFGLSETLNESWTPKKKDNIKEFALYCLKVLEIEKAPKVKLVQDSGTTALGYFDVDSEEIVVTYKDRHQMDIMRTLAHELVHRKQKEFGRELDGSTGSPDENEANSIAGILLRNWGKKNPHLFRESTEKIKGKDGKSCWKGYRYNGTKNGKDSCVKVKEDDDRNKVDPGTPTPFPAGTSLVNVSDVYDWYKLGMAISDLDDADPRQFNRGVPHTVIAFGSEEEEHKLAPLIKKLGFSLHDIDKPQDIKKAMLARDVIKKLESSRG